MSYIMEVMVVDSRALIFLLHMPISPSGQDIRQLWFKGFFSSFSSNSGMKKQMN